MVLKMVAAMVGSGEPAQSSLANLNFASSYWSKHGNGGNLGSPASRPRKGGKERESNIYKEM